MTPREGDHLTDRAPAAGGRAGGLSVGMNGPPRSGPVEVGATGGTCRESSCYQPQTTTFSLVSGVLGSGVTHIVERLH